MRSMSKRMVAALFAILLVATSLQAQNIPAELIQYPELIVHNGKIVTMSDATLNDSLGRTVQAMAVRDKRILAVGSNSEVLRLAGPQTRQIDLGGRTVVPGMINPHTHVHTRALGRWVVNNPDAVVEVARRFSVGGADYNEITRGIELVIKEQMANPLPGQWAWINLPSSGENGESGMGIGVQYLNDEAMTREQLDQLAPDQPVFVISHPKFLLNTNARDAFMNLYEVDPTPENEAVALPHDTTINRSLYVDRYFGDHLDQAADIIEDALKHQAALGFTTFSSHIVGLRVHDAYRLLQKEGRIPVRFAYADRFCQQVEPDIAGCFVRKSDMSGMGDDYFWNIGVTLGGLDSGPPAICTTMEAPPDVKAQELCILEPGNEYEEAIHAAMVHRLRFVVNHDYGDKTMDYVMDIMERVMEEEPAITLDYMRSRRLTADHCGFYPRPAQIPRMARLGMIISCGGRIVNRSAPWLDVYGKQYAGWISPIRGMLDGGLMPVAEGEFGVEGGDGPTAFAQYYPLITRTTTNGIVVAPEQAIDRNTLMKMATVWPSFFVIKEDDLGTLEAGKLADFIVFNKDYFTVPQEEIPTVYPLMTVLGGETTILREEWAQELGVPAVGPQMEFRYDLSRRGRE